MKFIKNMRFEVIVAFVTWLAITAVTIGSLIVNNETPVTTITLVGLLFCVFICSFLYSTGGRLAVGAVAHKLHLLLQIAAVFTLYFTVLISYVPILATIWSTQLVSYFSFNRAVMVSGLVSVMIFIAFYFYWDRDSALMSAFVYWMFNIFAIVTMDRAMKAEQAKAQADQLNRELIATQSLLTEATKQSERLRISRNIHDLVGHHLTALTINLQVARHLAHGQAKAAIDQSHAVAKLLLSDVRTAVAEIRDMSAIDLQLALQQLLDNTPQLTIHFSFDPSIKVTQVAMAEMLLRAVQEALTNTLKHGNATQIWLDFTVVAEQLLLNIKDDGYHQTGSDIVQGNGLLGMAERVLEQGGELKYQASAPYFLIEIKVELNDGY